MTKSKWRGTRIVLLGGPQLTELDPALIVAGNLVDKRPSKITLLNGAVEQRDIRAVAIIAPKFRIIKMFAEGSVSLQPGQTLTVGGARMKVGALDLSGGGNGA